MKKQLFQFSEVPADWALCFQTECLFHEQCLRWIAGSYAPKTVTLRQCVTPMAVKTAKPCKHHVNPEPVTLAYGFGDLFHNVRRNEYRKMRMAMMNLFNSETYYYRARRGERPIYPEQQETIRQLFEAYGYGENVAFDRTQETFFFPVATP